MVEWQELGERFVNKRSFIHFQVRLLTGIGRFSEMTFIFQTLMDHHHFELLVKKGVDNVSIFVIYVAYDLAVLISLLF